MASFALTCPAPLRRYPRIVMGHGSGGRMTQDLIEHLFAPAFGMNDGLGDAALLDGVLDGGTPAFTTDCFVVSPAEFPGGDIGSLAVHGTVNDLAVSGARPLALTAGFILEEGLELERLTRIVASMAEAAREAGVRVRAGDTKVVERGHGDGVYITTAGIGKVVLDPAPEARRMVPGDVLIVNGPLGDHGIAVMGLRHDLGLESSIRSDSAALWPLVETMASAGGLHALRDLTRGGLAAALNELAADASVGVEVVEADLPVRSEVRAACDLLGLDPLQVANEGKLVAAVPAEDAEAVLAAMRAHPLGSEAVVIGRVTDQDPGVVVGRTAIGSRRVIDMPTGELLPRIC